MSAGLEVNPYNCSAPGNLFVGYEAMRKSLLRGLRDGKSFALLGGRRCGKTSLLLKIQQELGLSGLAPFHVLPRLLDIQALVPHSPFEFFSRIYSLTTEGLSVEPWDTPPERQHYQEFLTRLEKARPQLEQAHGPRWLVVLLVDELDAAPASLPDDECFQNFRNLLSASRFKSHFRAVASGCSGMGQMIGSSSPLNILDPEYTRILTPAEARELISAGFPQGLEAGAEAELLARTGRHPYALQGLLGLLWEQPRPITQDMVRKAAWRFSRDRIDTFKEWLEDIHEEGRACYGALALAGDAALSTKAIRAQVPRGVSVSEGLRTLSYHGLIDEEDPEHPRIAGSLFKDWFLDQTPDAPPVPASAAPRASSAGSGFPPPLLEAFHSKRLALFVGSGLSLARDVQGSFPTWKQLPQRLLDACERLGTAEPRFIQAKRSMFEDDMRLEVMLAELGSLRSTLGRSYQQALDDIFRPRNPVPGAVHQAMARLGPSAILTTNYDPLIEELPETPRRHVYTWRESTQALNDLKSGRHVLLKIHGTAERADTVVMTELEYHHARADRSYQAVLSHLLQEYTFLFLGYGMNDPLDLDLVLKWNADVFHSAARRHYVLLKDPRGEDRDRYLREYNVQVSPYDDHGRLPDILEELRRAASSASGSNG
jgi:hypothetical protein